MLMKDRNTHSAVQTFCPRAGKCNLEASAAKHTGNTVRCVEDGDLIYTWADFDDDTSVVYPPETLSMVAGDDYAIRRATVTVVSGKFHIS